MHGAGLGLSEAVNNSLDAAVPVDVYDPMGWTAIHKVRRPLDTLARHCIPPLCPSRVCSPTSAVLVALWPCSCCCSPRCSALPAQLASSAPLASPAGSGLTSHPHVSGCSWWPHCGHSALAGARRRGQHGPAHQYAPARKPHRPRAIFAVEFGFYARRLPSLLAWFLRLLMVTDWASRGVFRRRDGGVHRSAAGAVRGHLGAGC